MLLFLFSGSLEDTNRWSPPPDWKSHLISSLTVNEGLLANQILTWKSPPLFLSSTCKTHTHTHTLNSLIITIHWKPCTCTNSQRGHTYLLDYFVPPASLHLHLHLHPLSCAHLLLFPLAHYSHGRGERSRAEGREERGEERGEREGGMEEVCVCVCVCVRESERERERERGRC